MFKQLRSWRHAFSLALSERIRGSRGNFVERPAGRLTQIGPEQEQRVAELAASYGVAFETSLGAETALRNYEYLDWLDRVFAVSGLAVPRPEVLCDAGCASFWYAASLAAFFKPGRLIGIDVEGYRRLKGGHTRIDYANGYLASLGQGKFVVADYRAFDQPADVVTSFFPFVTSPAVLAWRLPLSLLDPEGFFAQVRRNLRSGGLFLMVNHGPDEASQASRYCDAACLALVTRLDQAGSLSAYRAKPALVSVWTPR